MALQRVVRSAQRITRWTLPALQDIYSNRYHRKTKKIIKDLGHPSQVPFPPSTIQKEETVTGASKMGHKRLINSFYLQAIRLLNSHH